MKKPHGNIPVVILIAVSLAAATFGVYWRALSNGFVWDDIPYVLQNRHVQGGLTLSSTKWAFTSMLCANWHPLTWISAMLDYRLFGHSPSGYHLVNVLFHIANSILLMTLLIRMTGGVWRSGFVAALFALHPLHVESVAWVAERKDVLSTFLMFLTMLAYLRYAKRPNWSSYLLVALLFAMGLMSKPMLVTLPIVLLLLDYWPLARFTKKRPVAKLVWEKVPLLMLSVAASAVTYIAQQRGHALAPYSLGLRIENALVSYTIYIIKMVWPSGLAVHYPFPEHGIPAGEVIGSCAILAAISLTAIKARNRHPYLLWGWLWFLITLVPVIGFVQVGGQSMADRYTYVPLIGLFVAVAWVAPRSIRVLAPAVIVALMVCTVLQVRYWKNEETLFRRVVSVTDRDALAYNYLGVTLAMKGEMKQAEDNFLRALAVDPHNVAAHVNMGELLLEKKDKAGARVYFQGALKFDPDNPDALSRMAEIERQE
jgi:tetratricopeptide (TPR) repeat protein